jgi:E-phenylitaconyl-CoA hydratase
MSLRVEREGPILVITIDRPAARNALDRQSSTELNAAWRELREDGSLRVAVLTGAGDKAFCAGADLKEIRSWYGSMSPIERREHAERAPGLGGITRNLDPSKPVIAAINGHCLAGGLELAMACDVRVAAAHASFGLPEVKRGIMPGAGGTQRLPRMVPMGLALELLLTGDAIDAETALRIGLVNRVVPAEALLDEAKALALRIAKNAPLAVQTARAAALRGAHLPLHEGLRLEQMLAEPLRGTDDAAEGIAAFVEKREPEFKGS